MTYVDAADLAGTGVNQGAAMVGFIQNGTGAVGRTMSAKAKEQWSIADFLPTAFVIDGSVDYTTEIQAAIDALEAAGGGELHVPAGIFKGNWTFGSQVVIRGAGMRSTTFVPATATHVFKTATHTSTVRFGLRDCAINGSLSHSDCDGVHLESTSVETWQDTIYLENVHVSVCGRDGIRAVGTASGGPFVQRLFLQNVESINNKLSNLRLVGTVLETLAQHCSFCDVADTTGAGKPVSLEYNGDSPLQCTFINTLFSNGGALEGASGDAYGVWIGAGADINFLGCNFEFCDPCIYTANFALVRNVTVKGTKFAFASSADAAIHIKRCSGFALEDCYFPITGTATLAALVKNDSSIDGALNIDIVRPTIAGAVTNLITESAYYTTIVSGAITRYREAQVVLGEGSASDDLSTINDMAGGTTRFQHGDRLTLSAFSGFGTIKVKSGTGNIRLAGNADFDLDIPGKTITLMWNVQLTKWVEVSRSS